MISLITYNTIEQMLSQVLELLIELLSNVSPELAGYKVVPESSGELKRYFGGT